MRGGKLCVGIFLSCLLGTGIPLGIGLKVLSDRLPESSALAPALPAKVTPVYPAVLTGRPSVELGDFILSTMPDAASYSPNVPWHDWDWAASDEHIVWQPEFSRANKSDFLEEDDAEDVRRKGLVRINVLGDVSSILRETRQELGWDVSLSAPLSARAGAWEIILAPHECFSVPYKNCSYEIGPSLAHAGITADLKYVSQADAGYDYSYILHHADKADTLLIDHQRWGTGGDSQTISIMDSNEISDVPVEDGVAEKREGTNSVEQADIMHYSTQASEALKAVTGHIPEAKGKSCTLQISIDDRGNLAAIDALFIGNMGALCNAAIAVLEHESWPEPHHSLPVDFVVRVEG